MACRAWGTEAPKQRPRKGGLQGGDQHLSSRPQPRPTGPYLCQAFCLIPEFPPFCLGHLATVLDVHTWTKSSPNGPTLARGTPVPGGGAPRASIALSQQIP